MDFNVHVKIHIIKILKINNVKSVELLVKDVPNKIIALNVHKNSFQNKANVPLVYKIVKNVKIQQHVNYVNKVSHINKKIKNSPVLKQVQEIKVSSYKVVKKSDVWLDVDHV